MTTELEKISALFKLYNFPLRKLGPYYGEHEPNQYFPNNRKTIETHMGITLLLADKQTMNAENAYYHLEEVTKRIATIKDIVNKDHKMENIDLKQYPDQLYFYNSYINLLSHSRIISNSIERGFVNFKSGIMVDTINEYMTYWQEIANKNNIDVSEEILKINELKETIKNVEKLQKIGKMANEVFNYSNSLLGSAPNPRYLTDTETIHTTFGLLKSKINELSEITNTPEYEGMHQFLHHNKIPEAYQSIAIEIKNMHQKLLDNGLAFSYADQYQLDYNKSSISQFMNNKEDFRGLISFSLELNKSAKYEQIIVMKDESVAVKKNDEIISIKNTLEASSVIRDVLIDHISFNLRKKPSVAKFFTNKIKENDFEDFKYIVFCNSAIKTYLDNEDILKANNFDFSKEFPRSRYSFFEDLDDHMNKIVKDHKLLKYAFSIASIKYRDLYDAESYVIIEELMDNKVEESVLQDMIGKKMAAFKSPEEFNASLKKLRDSYSDFNEDALLEKANNCHAKIAVNAEQLLIIEIDNFEQSEDLGSSSWCISREEHYFNSYTSNGSRQYFIYNFNEPSDSNDSMVGITLNKDGTYYTAHLKNDDEISYSQSEYIKHFQKQIILNNLKDFPELSPKMMKWVKEDSTTHIISKIKSSFNAD